MAGNPATQIRTTTTPLRNGLTLLPGDRKHAPARMRNFAKHKEDERMGRLDGKTALITGAGRGIGRAIATLFASEGEKIAVTSYTQANIDRVVKEIVDAGGTAIGIACGVAEEAQIKAEGLGSASCGAR